MILIADSGSTKTDWLLLNNSKKECELQTVGFSPYFQETDDIIRILQADLIPKLDKSIVTAITNVFYYGTGCSSEAKCAVVSNALEVIFPSSKITINHDLLASARALCGKQAGIAAILGTGSNSCLFDGDEIIDNVPSLGIALGDEGSGGHIGKSLVQAYLYRELPIELEQKFDATFKTTKEEILDAVYKKPFPNRYLASYSRFVNEHIEHPFLKKLATNCINEFFVHHILKYKNYNQYRFNCVGSVGYNYKGILTDVCNKHNMEVGRIIATPMEGLILYHTE